MFFVATAPLGADTHINLSPKGMDSFRVIAPDRVAYLDIVGSGNETSAHILENGRITFMFCAYDGPPNILRLYGKGRTILPGDPEWITFSALFNLHPATRQIIIADIHQLFDINLYYLERFHELLHAPQIIAFVCLCFSFSA